MRERIKEKRWKQNQNKKLEVEFNIHSSYMNSGYRNYEVSELRTMALNNDNFALMAILEKKEIKNDEKIIYLKKLAADGNNSALFS